jgi:primosomal protein N' (replication factor Y)
LGEVIRAALPAGLNIVGKRQPPASSDTTGRGHESLTKGIACRTERCYRATGQTLATVLRGRTRAVLEQLLEEGELPARQLQERHGAIGPNLRRLLALGAVTVTDREVYRDPFRTPLVAPDQPRVLNSDQQSALDPVNWALDRGAFAPFLLHGVTGSGKTEVYLQAIARCLELGRSALVMVPEIALTPQLVMRFRRRFSCGIAVLHSALSPGERYDEWRRIRRGEARIAIGARSAIFAPLQNLGMIVVDEEHEAAYKQGEGLRYNARDLSLVLGQQRRCPVLLGSATPLVTTSHAADQGRLTRLQLPVRVAGRPLPTTLLLDQRGDSRAVLLPELRQALAENLAAGNQSLLFLNRRGYATCLVCRDCGHRLSCPNCNVTLTFHQQKQQHICHYCDHAIPAPSLCPGCGNGEIVLLGLGTERLREEVANLFPQARIGRMDRDTTRGRDGHDRILSQLERGDLDILIGTQMIAKGHDLPGVTLVGVVSVDTVLSLPDFRGEERAFQLVSQVMGRAGRGDIPGTVYIQTYHPDHFALVAAAAHTYDEFYRQELDRRQDAGYPPFCHLAAIHLSGTSARQVEAEADRVGRTLRDLRQAPRERIEILGPAPAPLAKIRGRHRWHLLLKALRRTDLHNLLQRFRTTYSSATVRIALDVDPLDLI